jgi:long-chain fatty acid transport protein
MKMIERNRLSAVVACTLAAASSTLMAAGYKIPETSSNATALSAAYVANAKGPDASYYNPAGMALDEGGGAIRGDLTYIHLPSIDFTGTQGPFPASDSSEKENFLIPALHYVSPYVGKARFGLSIVAPAGLSKRWKGWGATSAEEFSLQTIEVNPTAGYRINDKLAIGGGLRMVYSSGKVKSTIPGSAFRDMKGDSIDFGYNLAAHFNPTERLALAATYRSKVDLTVKGDAKLGSGALTLYDGSARVTVPLPAALAIATAFDFTDRTTAEFVFERTYWSAYDELDFKYGSPIAPPPLKRAFDDPIPKDWKDSNTYRFGITHQLDDKWTLMGGFALDESPVPKRTVGFELPESDGQIFSVGGRYKATKQLEIDAGILYTRRDKLKLKPGENQSGLVGEFKDAGALLVSVGAVYRFE